MSTILYASGAWDFDYRDIVETVRAMFVKQTLTLPSRTPGYPLRLKINYTEIESEISKSTLRSFLVMTEKEKATRLPKIFL